MKLVFVAPLIDPTPWVDRLARELPEAQVWAWDAARAGEQADYAVVWVPDNEFFATQTGLKAIFNMGAGVDRLLSLSGLPRELPLYRLDDADKPRQMAEYVCHALIGFTRGFDRYADFKRDARWEPLTRESPKAFPVGVMGLGAIGAHVAQSVAAFGYPVLGWSRTRKALEGVRTFAGDDELDAFLHECRVLVCVLPLTPETRGILNARNLAKLRPQSQLINVGRSGHLVEADLPKLLDAGVLASATLDVFSTEPLPPAHPFWRHPGIRITPHIAADTSIDDSLVEIATKIRACARGEEPSGRVDFTRGY